MVRVWSGYARPLHDHAGELSLNQAYYRTDEIDRIGKHIRHLTQEEAVRPRDICVIYNGKRIAEDLQKKLRPELKKIGIELSLQTNRPFERNDNTLVMTTSHSYKGYESEVIIIPCVDQYVTGRGKILSNNLYVAMTRARSLLAIYGTRNGSSSAKQIFDELELCVNLLNSTPTIETETSRQDDFNDLLEQIGVEHRKWLRQLWKRFDIKQEPILDDSGKVLAQPLFWLKHKSSLYVCHSDSADSAMPAEGILLTLCCDLRSIGLIKNN
jgi:superfamily I DNA and RNA helicase